MTGWTWYCDEHDSFGLGDTQLEVQHVANAHANFHANLAVPCRLYIKNQGDPPTSQSLTLPVNPKTPKPSNYMARVKENFARAWQRWDPSEDTQLRENFNQRKDLNELTIIHQRAKGGIVARLKKLRLLDLEIEVQEASELLANNHEKLIKAKTYKGKLRVVQQGASPSRVDRGKDSLAEYGMVNPPPVPHPELKHTSIFACSICQQPVIGNSCHCRGD